MRYQEKKTQAYKGGNNGCRLSLGEKLCILENAEDKLPNKRTEVISKWRRVNVTLGELYKELIERKMIKGKRVEMQFLLKQDG